MNKQLQTPYHQHSWSRPPRSDSRSLRHSAMTSVYTSCYRKTLFLIHNDGLLAKNTGTSNCLLHVTCQFWLNTVETHIFDCNWFLYAHAVQPHREINVFIWPVSNLEPYLFYSWLRRCYPHSYTPRHTGTTCVYSDCCYSETLPQNTHDNHLSQKKFD